MDFFFPADTCTGCHSLSPVLLIQDKRDWYWQRWNMPSLLNNKNVEEKQFKHRCIKSSLEKGLTEWDIGVLPHKSLMKTGTVFYICGSLLDLRLPLSPLKAAVVSELCQAKPTYSCRESLQGYVVTETGANLQPRNTFKFLPWPDSAKSLEPVV